MEPTLKNGDTLLVMSAGYSAETGDIVVIDDKKANLIGEDDRVIEKDGLGCKIVKRIIAKGGDTIDIDFEKGIVYVNGKVLEENLQQEMNLPLNIRLLFRRDMCLLWEITEIFPKTAAIQMWDLYLRKILSEKLFCECIRFQTLVL